MKKVVEIAELFEELLQHNKPLPDIYRSISAHIIPCLRSEYSEYKDSKIALLNYLRDEVGDPITLIAFQSTSVVDSKLNRKIWTLREFRQYPSLLERIQGNSVICHEEKILNVVSIDVRLETLDTVVEYISDNNSNSFLLIERNNTTANSVFEALTEWGAKPFFEDKSFPRIEWSEIYSLFSDSTLSIIIGVGWNEDGGDFRYIHLTNE